MTRAMNVSRLAVSASIAVMLALGALIPPASATPGRPPVGSCFHPKTPHRFHQQVVTAIRVSRDLPHSWAAAPEVAKIVCWQGTDFKTDFVAHGRAYYDWHGMFAMTTQEMQTIFGRWMTRTRGAFELTQRCFVRGWSACPHRTADAAAVQQIIAGLRWIWLNYGTPAAAWEHIKRTGRFNSYPRKGTDNKPTRSPLRRCPVVGPVHYQDDFGEARTVGGYHPHWGNDVIAPLGRAIRAPFDGFAVAHSDSWFAGHYVTVVGEQGYVRNGHMSRFAHLGWVKAGTIIGYVGATGDARGPHDHFEWHPWAVPSPRHRAPSGFSLIMDAIDPYPFLNKACGGSLGAIPTRSVIGPSED